MNAIVISDLEKKFKNKIAVNKINLTIKENELFALLGVNGAGKSTTIKILSCLIKPTGGEVTILNNKLGKDNGKIKELINLSPQETAVAPNLSVYENLEFIANIYGITDKEKIEEIIKIFKLESVRNDKTRILSGGYARRLSIAMALITEPKVLFLDEPTLGLDVIARRELWNIIEKLKSKMTIILTTHYMEEAEMLSDRIGIMKKGDIIEIDTAKNIIKKTKCKNFEDAFIKIVSEAV